MKTLTAKLIEENHRQRFYELSEPIHEGKSDILGDIDIGGNMKESIKLYEKSNKDGKYDSVIAVLKDGNVRHLCISDARTHIERLVFPAFKFTHEGKEYLTGLSGINEIGGKHTYMIEGGDYRSIYPDEVYIRRLCQINGYKYGGLI